MVLAQKTAKFVEQKNRNKKSSTINRNPNLLHTIIKVLTSSSVVILDSKGEEGKELPSLNNLSDKLSGLERCLFKSIYCGDLDLMD